MDLQEAKTLAENLIAKWNIDQLGWSFQFDRAKKRFGCCKYSKKLITLSKNLTLLNDREKVKDTILHEIAHALAGPQAKHGPEWKAWAVRVGARPKRCYNSKEVNTVRHQYEIICGCCLKVISKRHRRPSKNLELSYHNKCGRKSLGKCFVRILI